MWTESSLGHTVDGQQAYGNRAWSSGARNGSSMGVKKLVKVMEEVSVTHEGRAHMPEMDRELIFINFNHSVGSHPTQQVLTIQIESQETSGSGLWLCMKTTWGALKMQISGIPLPSYELNESYLGMDIILKPPLSSQVV